MSRMARFKAMISCDPVPGFGRVEPLADLGVAHRRVHDPELMLANVAYRADR